MPQTPNDILFPVIAVAIGFAVLAFFLVFVIINYYRVHARRKNEIIQSVFSSLTKERHRIARDLHDEMGMRLNGIKMRVGDIRETPGRDDINKIVSETEELLTHVSMNMRAISHNLMPKAFAQYGLIAALEEQVSSIAETHHLKINFEHSGFETRLNPEFELNLYRIINEMFNNMLKHSGANTVEVTLRREKKNITLFFSDNGKGFSDEQIPINIGTGLKNIQDRIYLYGGKYSMESEHNKGTTFTVQFAGDVMA